MRDKPRRGERRIEDALAALHRALTETWAPWMIIGGIVIEDPFRIPPRFEKLVDDLAGAYSRRIHIHHRLVHQVLLDSRTIKVLRMWTHYE